MSKPIGNNGKPSKAYRLQDIYNRKVSPTNPEKGVWTLHDQYVKPEDPTTPPPPDPVDTTVSIADPTMPFWLNAGLSNTIFHFSSISASLATAFAMGRMKM